MSEIRKHIEEEVANSTREYDETYYHWNKATQAFKSAKVELDCLTASLAKARKNMEYFQKLLNELNETNGNEKFDMT
jgi:hypothetical protein